MMKDQFSVYWVDFAFIDKPGSSIRPALFIDGIPMSIGEKTSAIKITSKDKRNKEYIEYELKHWKYAGLTQPSVVRLSSVTQPVEFMDKALKGKIGNLHKEDIMEILKLIHKYRDTGRLYSHT